jgi:hypothetical protein
MKGAVPMARSVLRLLHTQISMPETRLSFLRELNIAQKIFYQGYTHSRVGHRWCSHYRINLPEVLELKSLEEELEDLSVKSQVLKIQIRSNRSFKYISSNRISIMFLSEVRLDKFFRRPFLKSSKFLLKGKEIGQQTTLSRDQGYLFRCRLPGQPEDEYPHDQ